MRSELEEFKELTGEQLQAISLASKDEKVDAVLNMATRIVSRIERGTEYRKIAVQTRVTLAACAWLLRGIPADAARRGMIVSEAHVSVTIRAAERLLAVMDEFCSASVYTRFSNLDCGRELIRSFKSKMA
jgi:hypothetical protein